MCDACINRRHLLIGSLAALGSLAGTPSAFAQVYILLCSWAGGGGIGEGLAKADSTYELDVAAIARLINFQWPIQVYVGGVANASATVLNDGPAIVYNADFLEKLSQCNPLAATTVLAHEVGHHAMADTVWMGLYGSFKDPWQKELAADWVSGLAMKRMGISLESTLSGIECSMGSFSPGSPTHPDSQKRLFAIKEGWTTD